MILDRFSVENLKKPLANTPAMVYKRTIKDYGGQ